MSRGQKEKAFPGEKATQGRRWGSGEQDGDITYLLCTRYLHILSHLTTFHLLNSLLTNYYLHFIDKVIEVHSL